MYALRFDRYEGQKFEVVFSEAFRQKYIRVVSDIVKKGRKSRKLEYLLMETNGAWLIVDVQVEGVSQLSLTGSQFKTVLRNKGLTGLLVGSG